VRELCFESIEVLLVRFDDEPLKLVALGGESNRIRHVSSGLTISTNTLSFL